MNYLVIGGVVGLLLGLHLFFVVAAVSIKRTSSQKLRELARKGCSRATHARIILMRSARYLLSAQIGVFLTTLILGFALTSMARALALNLSQRYMLEYYLLSKIVLVCALFGVVALIALLLVQVAKGLARLYPERCLCILATPFIFVSKLLSPFIITASSFSALVLKPFGLARPSGRDNGISPEEISQMLELSSESGQIEEDEREMIQRVFNFSETLVTEVMTPRSDIVWVKESSALADILQTFAVERLSRVVVIGRDLDEVRGVLHAKDLIQCMGKDPKDFEIQRIMRKPYFVAGDRKTGELLPELREHAVHLAIVTDEHGGVDGLITLEDLVEEIVGEILDEYDSPNEEVEARRTKSGDLVLDGAMLIDDLNSEYRLNLPVGAYDTLAGFISHALGRIPLVGEFVKYEGLRFRVEDVEQNRITKVRLMRVRRISLPAQENPTKRDATAPSSEANPQESQGSIARISNSR